MGSYRRGKTGQRKAASEKRHRAAKELHIANKSATHVHCMFTCLLIDYRHTELLLFEFGNDLIPFITEDRGQHVTPIKISAEKTFSCSGQIWNLGQREIQDAAPPHPHPHPHSGPEGECKIFSFTLSPLFPLCLQHLHLFTASRANLFVPLHNPPSVTSHPLPCPVKPSDRSIHLPQEVSSRQQREQSEG